MQNKNESQNEREIELNNFLIKKLSQVNTMNSEYDELFDDIDNCAFPNIVSLLKEDNEKRKQKSKLKI